MSPKFMSPQIKFFSVGLGVTLGLLCSCGVGVVFGVVDTYATASTLTVSVTAGADAFVNIPPTSEGKFGATGATTFGVTTTHGAGYTLTASATALSFTDTEGTNGTENAVYTIDNLASGTTISASTFESDSAYKNKWGFLPSRYCTSSDKSSCIDNVDDRETGTTAMYIPAPINATQTLDITDDATDNDYDIIVGTKLDHTIAMGGYTTTVTLTAVGNATPYTIYYNSNLGTSGDTATDMPSTTTATATGETVTLAAESPHRTTASNTAYLFAGWCTASVPIDGYCNSTDTGDANAAKYEIGGTYALDQTAAENEVTMYAMWRTDPCYGKTAIHDLVTCQVKTTEDNTNETLTEKTQVLADMRAFLTEPVSDSPYADTSNSGVYKYNTDFGTASDAANTEDIYYFRGILDKTYKYSDAPNGETSGIPSSGDSNYYQNFVKLSTGNTCWRIVRTTGSGGTKMIYNGTWSATDGCARQQENAQVSSTYYNRGAADANIDYYHGGQTVNDSNLYGTRGFVVYVGYNYNDDYKYAGDPWNNSSYNTATSNGTLFKNTNGQGTMTESNLKTVIDNWYDGAGNLDSYVSKLEKSAGWCNDRTTAESPAPGNTTVPYAPGTNYGTNGGVTFGSGIRDSWGGDRHASLTCPNITGEDLLTVDNGFLNNALAPLTEDEVVFAGHGYPVATTVEGQTKYFPTIPTTYSSSWSYRSYLRSGSYFWLLSPGSRIGSSGYVYAFVVGSTGYSGNVYVSFSNGVRPAISLTSGTTVASGSGTASDPWVINP